MTNFDLFRLQYNNLKVLYEKFGKYEYHFWVRLDPTELVSVGITQAGAYFILIEYKSAEPNDNTAYGIYVSHKGNILTSTIYLHIDGIKIKLIICFLNNIKITLK